MISYPKRRDKKNCGGIVRGRLCLNNLFGQAGDLNLTALCLKRPGESINNSKGSDPKGSGL